MGNGIFSPAGSGGDKGGAGSSSDATARFFTLRKSGYSGPIDQNGNKAADPKGILGALRQAAAQEPKHKK